MINFLPNSIKGRYLLVNIVLSVTTILILSTFSIWNNYQDHKRFIIDSTSSISKVITPYVLRYIEKPNKDDLQHVNKILSSYPLIKQYYFFDINEKKHIGFSTEENEPFEIKSISQEYQQNQFLYIKHGVKKSENLLGDNYFKVSTEKINNELWGLIRISFAVMILLAVISILVGRYLMMRVYQSLLEFLYQMTGEQEHAKLENSKKDETEVLKDIYDQMKDEISKQNTQLLQTERRAAVGEMTASITHQLNNPLAIIRGGTELISKLLKAEQIDKEKIQLLNTRISATAARMNKTIRSLLNFSRGEEKEKAIHTVRETLDEALVLCEDLAKSAGVELLVGDFSSKYKINGSMIQLAQVFLNLINNAIYEVKNTTESWVRVSVKEVDQHIVISVVDSGAGISEEMAEKILDPFYSTKPEGEGTGLGLSLANKIVREHGGILQIDTTAKNTTFLVILPLVTQEAVVAAS